MRSPEPSGLKWCQKQNGTLSTGSPLTAACTRSLGVIVLICVPFQSEICCFVLLSLAIPDNTVDSQELYHFSQLRWSVRAIARDSPYSETAREQGRRKALPLPRDGL